MIDTISTVFMILALLLAVVAGLWFGAVLGESTSGTDKDGKPVKRRSFTSAVQNIATTTAVRLWKWNRARNKQQKRDYDQL